MSGDDISCDRPVRRLCLTGPPTLSATTHYDERKTPGVIELTIYGPMTLYVKRPVFAPDTPHDYTPGVCRVRGGRKDPLLGENAIVTLTRGDNDLLDVEGSSFVDFVQSTRDNIELCVDRYVKNMILKLPRYVNGVDELAKTKALLDIANTEIKSLDDHLKAKLAEVEALKNEKDQLLAEADGYEHERARLKTKIGRLQAKLAKANKVVEAYMEQSANALQEKAEAIKERDFYKNRQIHFKKYRKWMINMIAARANKSACNVDDIEPFLSEFPELRESVVKLTVFARKFQAFSSVIDTLTDKQRISSIRFARQLEELNGAEHSSASGSTPESR